VNGFKGPAGFSQKRRRNGSADAHNRGRLTPSDFSTRGEEKAGWREGRGHQEETGRAKACFQLLNAEGKKAFHETATSIAEGGKLYGITGGSACHGSVEKGKKRSRREGSSYVERRTVIRPCPGQRLVNKGKKRSATEKGFSRRKGPIVPVMNLAHDPAKMCSRKDCRREEVAAVLGSAGRVASSFIKRRGLAVEELGGPVPGGTGEEKPKKATGGQKVAGVSGREAF